MTSSFQRDTMSSGNSSSFSNYAAKSREKADTKVQGSLFHGLQNTRKNSIV